MTSIACSLASLTEVVNAELVALRFQATSPCIGIDVGLSIEAARHMLSGSFTLGPWSKCPQSLDVYWRVWEAHENNATIHNCKQCREIGKFSLQACEFELLRTKTPRWGMHPTSPYTPVSYTHLTLPTILLV
eukprot:4521115-Amphidinium_carterae.1